MSIDNDNPEEEVAVALTYDRGMKQAPQLSAKGRGNIAAEIIRVAEEHNIPIVNDGNLVEVLSALELESFIPLEAYEAVAEILSYIYSKNNAL